MIAWSAFVTTAARLDYALPRLAGRATLVGAHLSKLRGRDLKGETTLTSVAKATTIAANSS